ncbi:DUF6705 family protein [Chryseobacterium oryctis]|uniref:DUF6705 domain-containing protein n=1 Tax=Chryseobacterium oryctis TaxID=2952618 RepID=A0ABT3HL10_9FLAO|nr:DUF6705 family protein [Chryseobacterium oryctis]MCW3160360.1 hypothetical protein [Chryseobacterium oryctis]
MKKISILIFAISLLYCKAQEQTLPLTTMNNELPLNAYIKDTENQLPAFEGTWKGKVNDKTFTIVLKKAKYYDTLSQSNPFYKDLLWGKFQVKDSNDKILFDNLSLQDNYSKIQGRRIYPSGKYELIYLDPDLCNKVGLIMIGFTDDSKKELKFRYKDYPQNLDSSCFYYGKPAEQQPEPLPKEIILTKQ